MERLTLKYRPKNYNDLIGQKHVVTILNKMHEKNVIPSGLLLQGSRGTGKTTVARIYAMKLNCTSADSPCGVCTSCKAIIDGTSNSVAEIDAASHGNVDDIRQIKDRSQYGHGGKYRVWLIDEAHSLSRKANDALLKVLEEPPVNTVFILVTTEPEEILETVRSRLMPFEFRRVVPSDIVERLKYVCDSEGMVYNEKVLYSIAEFVEGGVRNALMMIEQLYYYPDGLTSLEAFYDLYGVVGNTIYDDLFLLILDGEHEKGQRLIVDSFSRASEGGLFIKGMIKYLTNILIYKQGVERNVNIDIAKSIGMDSLFKMINLLWAMMSRVKYSTGIIGFAPHILYCSLVELLGSIERQKVVECLSTNDVLDEFKDLL